MQHSAQKRGQGRLPDAAAQESRGVADAEQRDQQVRSEGTAIVGPAVGELALRQCPAPFVRVQLRGVGGEPLEVQAGELGAQGADEGTLVDLAAVPQHDDGAPEMAQELPEKAAHLRRMEVLVVELEVEAEALAPRADRQAGDDRDAVVALPVAEQGSLAGGGPGPAHAGDEQEPGLVYEDEVGAQPRGVFFTRGHSARFHRAMAASSRSRARRSGFCGVQPRAWRSRPTWSGWYWMPKWRSITSATRAVVHRSVRYPWASDPRRSRRTRCCRWCLVSFGGRPGETPTRKPRSPRRRTASRQRITELAAQCSHRATAWSEWPSCTSVKATRRRASSTAADPRGRMVAALLVGQRGQPLLLHYLCRSQ